LTRSIKRNHS